MKKWLAVVLVLVAAGVGHSAWASGTTYCVGAYCDDDPVEAVKESFVPAVCLTCWAEGYPRVHHYDAANNATVVGYDKYYNWQSRLAYFQGCPSGSTWDAETHSCFGCEEKTYTQSIKYSDLPLFMAAGDGFAVGGCENVPLTGDADFFNDCYTFDGDPDQTVYCEIKFYQTGQAAASGQGSAGDSTDPPPPEDRQYDAGGNATQETQTDPPVTQSDTPNTGDTTTTENETTTTNKPKQTNITTSTDTIKIKTDSGENITQTTKTTTTTFSDGSTEVKKETTFSNTGSTSTTTTIKKSDGSSTTTTSSTPPTGGSTTTTTSTGADGSKSSSTTSTGAGGDGKGDPADEDSKQWKPGEPGDFSDGQAEIDAAKEELLQVINQIRAESETIIDPLTESSGALPCWSFNALGHTYNICLSTYETELSVIAKAILFVAVFLALYIVLK